MNRIESARIRLQDRQHACRGLIRLARTEENEIHPEPVDPFVQLLSTDGPEAHHRTQEMDVLPQRPADHDQVFASGVVPDPVGTQTGILEDLPGFVLC